MSPTQPEFWTPERRRAHGIRSKEVLRAYYADPANLARQGFLQAHERDAIVEMARSGKRYIEIALEYLISESRVSKIAIAAGVRRQEPGKSRKLINVTKAA